MLATSTFVGLGATAAFAGSPSTTTAATAARVSPTAAASTHVGKAAYTREFHIDNLSGRAAAVDPHRPVPQRHRERPADGTIIAPGGSMLLEMTWIWEEDLFADPRFDVLDDSGNVLGTLAVTIAVGSGGSTGAASLVTSGNFQTSLNTDQDTADFDDPAGTVRTVNGNQAQLQAQLPVTRGFLRSQPATETFSGVDGDG